MESDVTVRVVVRCGEVQAQVTNEASNDEMSSLRDICGSVGAAYHFYNSSLAHPVLIICS
jgi:hypothetical protein